MKISSIQTGKFKLDGGAMFGVVPKRMWHKLHPADDDNMCTWQMRCLLIQDGNKNILIDTGLGTKQDAKFRSHFLPHDELTFDMALAEQGLTRSDITDVIITHFHFDHVGGAVTRDTDGHLIPIFPNATYWSNASHYQWAMDPNPREAASFLKENFVPLHEHGVLKFIDEVDGVAWSDNITIHFVHGHTQSMMLPHIALPNGKTLVYCADLIPSHHHIPVPYVMAYDVRPLNTLKEKQAFYERINTPAHILMFEHDETVEAGTLTTSETGKVVFGEQVSIASILA